MNGCIGVLLKVLATRKLRYSMGNKDKVLVLVCNDVAPKFVLSSRLDENWWVREGDSNVYLMSFVFRIEK